jgi:uncharacterized protein YprB with RNaseH-like and TPR domain
VYNCALPDFELYSREPHNDREVVKQLHWLVSNADFVVTYNGDRYDIKKMMARFVYHNLKPPKRFKSIDCYKKKKYFSFNSNSLDAVAQHLKLGKKKETGGFGLWQGCMAGEQQSWRRMIQYCNRDIELLEKVYLKIRGYYHTHPDTRQPFQQNVCPTCCSNAIVFNGGIKITKRTVKQQFRCGNCGQQWYI